MVYKSGNKKGARIHEAVGKRAARRYLYRPCQVAHLDSSREPPRPSYSRAHNGGVYNFLKKAALRCADAIAVAAAADAPFFPGSALCPLDVVGFFFEDGSKVRASVRGEYIQPAADLNFL